MRTCNGRRQRDRSSERCTLCQRRRKAVDRGLADTKAQIEAEGGTVIARCVDIATEENVRELVDLCESDLGALDIIYANAGISGGRVPLLEGTQEEWMEILRINLIGPFLAIKHGAPK